MSKRKRNSYLESWEKSIHARTAKLTLEQEEEVLRAFQSATRDLISKINKSRNGYLPLRIYKDYAYDLYSVMLETMSRYSKQAVENVIDGQLLLTLKLLGEDGQATAQDFEKTLRQVSLVYSRIAAEGVVKGTIYKDGKNLSTRIWSAAARAGNDVQHIVTQALSSGMSATDLSKMLEKYINPKARKNWDRDKIAEKLGASTANKYKNLEYNSLRLARTTISHSATAGVRRWGQINPFAKKIQWHSVHAPGRTCQACIDLDGEIFLMEECPFDHPNGMCYQTVWYDKSMDEMADELRDWVHGKPNEELDSWYEDLLSGKIEKDSEVDFVKSY